MGKIKNDPTKVYFWWEVRVEHLKLSPAAARQAVKDFLTRPKTK